MCGVLHHRTKPPDFQALFTIVLLQPVSVFAALLAEETSKEEQVAKVRKIDNFNHNTTALIRSAILLLFIFIYFYHTSPTA